MKLDAYTNYLTRHGRNLAEVKKNQSDVIIDRTFKRDPNYKRVYILTRDGWKFEDAKYQVHTTPSILKDAVDYYLQFRPKVHYPIGSYVIVPDDTEFDINLTEEQLSNPWLQPVSERTQWWFIVGRDEARSYVRYNILRCNYEFKWIWHGQIMKCFGAVRNANSYTSGVWRNDYGYYLDNIDSAWMPDILYTYGEKFQSLGLMNNQTLTYDVRLMVTNSVYEPKVYQITKVSEMTPQGIIKLTFKQDDFNEMTDNPQKLICDYYTPEGNIRVDIEPSSVDKDIVKYRSIISWQIINENGELIPLVDEELQHLSIGKASYFFAEFFDNENLVHIDPEWKIVLINDQDYTADDIEYYTNLVTITEFDDSVIAVKPAKAGSLSEKKFRLSVNDGDGNYYSSIDLEVM